MTRELNRGPVGLMRWIRREMDKRLPRQAVVVRGGGRNGKGAWVRFTPAEASQPAVWFPSVVSDLEVGVSGWVVTIPGGKGLFVPAELPNFYSRASVDSAIAEWRPRVESFEQVNFISVSSAGTYVFGTPLTFSGLNPNAMYNVVFTVSWTVSATAARVATGTRFTNIWYPGGFDADHDAAQNFTNLSIAASGFTCSHQLQPTPAGVITIVPYARWTSGSLTIHRGRFVATVSRRT